MNSRRLMLAPRLVAPASGVQPPQPALESGPPVGKNIPKVVSHRSCSRLEDCGTL